VSVCVCVCVCVWPREFLSEAPLLAMLRGRIGCCPGHSVWRAWPQCCRTVRGCSAAEPYRAHRPRPSSPVRHLLRPGLGQRRGGARQVLQLQRQGRRQGQGHFAAGGAWSGARAARACGQEEGLGGACAMVGRQGGSACVQEDAIAAGRGCGCGTPGGFGANLQARETLKGKGVGWLGRSTQREGAGEAGQGTPRTHAGGGTPACRWGHGDRVT